jgi:hypothetical protein
MNDLDCDHYIQHAKNQKNVFTRLTGVHAQK